jgi:hypothetical protein
VFKKKRGAVLSALLPALLLALPAAAGPNDIDLHGLIEEDGNGGFREKRAGDFESLTRELTLVFTPSPLQPAETTGQSGFEFGLNYRFHDISDEEAYWSEAVEGARDDRTLSPVLQTIGMTGRKGWVLPIPLTSEIILGADYLIDSRMWNLGANIRLALHEMGAFNSKLWMTWFPDIAVMGGANRPIGSDQLDLFSATGGGTVSKNFALAGSFSLTPFLAYQSIFVNAASRTIDGDPTNVRDVTANFVFEEVSASVNRFDRVTTGMRLIWGVVLLAGGVDFNMLPSGNTMMQYDIHFGLSF